LHLQIKSVCSLLGSLLDVHCNWNLFNPIKIKNSSPEKLPPEYLPSEDVSINGTMMTPRTEPNRLSIIFHVFSKSITDGKIPFVILSWLQEKLQQYIRLAAHTIDTSRSSRIVAPFSIKDWATLRLVSVSAGSFRMECTSNSNKSESEKISRAWQILGRLTSDDFNNIDDLKGQIGDDALFFAFLLAEYISKLDLSMSISWAAPGTPSGYLAFDKRRARYVRTSLRPEKIRIYDQSITITLAEDAAKPIRRKVVGTGGMQSLLRSLQNKLTDENVISLTMDEVEKIRRYGMNYGRGGFQDRLAGIARALERVYISFQSS
jgi:hypothetical protein